MKTTTNIADDLLVRAKALAADQRTTLRALIEEGLRWVVSRPRSTERFVLRDATVPGHGVCEGLSETDWGAIRELISRGRSRRKR